MRNCPHPSLLSEKVKTPNEDTRSHEWGFCCCCRRRRHPPTSAITWPWQSFKFSCGLWQHRQKTGWMSTCNVTVDCWCIRKDTDSLILDRSAWFVARQRRAAEPRLRFVSGSRRACGVARAVSWGSLSRADADFSTDITSVQLCLYHARQYFLGHTLGWVNTAKELI